MLPPSRVVKPGAGKRNASNSPLSIGTPAPFSKNVTLTMEANMPQSGHKIIAADNSILRDTLAAQARFFRKCEAAGLTFKALHYDTGIPVATLQSWAKETAMPLAALNRFARAGVADALLSILTEPGGKVVCEDDADGCLDALGVEAAGYVSEWAAAKHPESEAGVFIGPNERQTLGKSRGRLAVVAGMR